MMDTTSPRRISVLDSLEHLRGARSSSSGFPSAKLPQSLTVSLLSSTRSSLDSTRFSRK